MEKVTGYSLAQVTRLIRQYRESGEIQPAPQGRQRLSALRAVKEAPRSVTGPCAACFVLFAGRRVYTSRYLWKSWLETRVRR